MRQNIALRLDSDLIRKAKVLAAQEGTSVSGLLARYLEKVIDEEEVYEVARTRALSFLTGGSILGERFFAPAKNGMSDKVFVDTNILIYAHDLDAGHKRTVAPPPW